MKETNSQEFATKKNDHTVSNKHHGYEKNNHDCTLICHPRVNGF